MADNNNKEKRDKKKVNAEKAESNSWRANARTL